MSERREGAASEWLCPECGGALKPVGPHPYLNDDQWDSMKAGDWYCTTCRDDSTRSGHKYFRDGQLRDGKESGVLPVAPSPAVFVAGQQGEGRTDAGASLRSAVLLAAKDIRASIELWEERDRLGHGPWDARIARLHEVLRSAQRDAKAPTSDSRAASSGERVDWQRVCDWMRDPQRKPADMAFTAGPERQLAYAFEDASGERVTDADVDRSVKAALAAGATKVSAEVVRAVLESRRTRSGRETPFKLPPTTDEIRQAIHNDPWMLVVFTAGKEEGARIERKNAAKCSEANTPAPALPGPGQTVLGFTDAQWDEVCHCGHDRHGHTEGRGACLSCLLPACHTFRVPGPGSEEANPYTVERAKLMLAIGKVQAFLDERCTGNTYCLMPHEEWTLIERTARAWLTFGPRDAGTPLSGRETPLVDPILDLHQCQINPATMRCFRCGLLYRRAEGEATSPDSQPPLPTGTGGRDA